MEHPIFLFEVYFLIWVDVVRQVSETISHRSAPFQTELKISMGVWKFHLVFSYLYE